MKRIAAIFLSLCIPALSWADLTNIAQVSYQDASGAAHSATSNTVTVTVNSAPPAVALPAPTLNLPAFLPINGTLSAAYPSGYSQIQFQWSLVFLGPSIQGSARADVQKSPAISQTTQASFQTASNTADLANYTLEPGYYSVSVVAMDSTGDTSAPAQAHVTLVLSDLASVRVFPNPWRSDRHNGKPVTFDNLTQDSTVKIFTVSGHLVKTLPANTNSASWDLTNDAGAKVASGVYLHLVTTPSGQRVRGQLAVIH